MKQLHEGLDYKLYKVYVWGGLALLVIYLVVSILMFEATSLPDRQLFLRLLLPIIVYIAGILIYWWWVFLFKGNRELAELGQEQEQVVPDIQALKSWNILHQAMAVSGGSVDEFIRNARRANRPILVWYGITNLLAVYILVPIALGTLGIIGSPSKTAGFIWLGGLFAGIVLMMVVTPILASFSGRSAEEAILAPLGLAVTRTPTLGVDVIALISGGQQLIPDGPATVEGERHGRLIHIETIDRHSLTVVQEKTPPFQVQSNEGKLVPDKGAPDAVRRALRRLRKAKRWRGIAVHAGPGGIAVQRESTGTNMWLYDLWLAEYLGETLSG